MEALKDRDSFFTDLNYEVYNYSDYDDEQLIRYNRFMKVLSSLSQFERDIYYLRLNMSVSEIASLYSISDTYIYRTIKEIKQKLNTL